MDRLIEFMQGVDWDRNDSVRLMALDDAGEYLYYRDVSKGRPKEVFELLEKMIAENRFDCPITRGAAEDAIERALGATSEEILIKNSEDESYLFDDEDDLMFDIADEEEK